MDRFQELHVNLGNHDFSAAIAVMERSARNNWSRDKAAEEHTKHRNLGDYRSMACFRQEGRAHYYPAYLWLAEESPHLVKVTNIVPGGEQSQMSYSEYNSVLQDFCQSVLRPVRAYEISYDLSDDRLKLSDFASPDVVRKLESFSRAANKSTGSAHPCDFKRWADFIIACHKEKCSLDGHTLGRWLREAEHWGDEVSSRLVGEFEFAKDLLKEYDAGA